MKNLSLFARTAKIVALSTVLACSAAGVGNAAGMIGKAPSVRVTIDEVASQAELAQKLNALGYSDVRLSSLYPSPADPNPAPNTGNTATTPVHRGWNGTAVKNGEKYPVYVTYGESPSVAAVE